MKQSWWMRFWEWVMYRSFELAHINSSQAMVVISKDDSVLLVGTTITETVDLTDSQWLETYPGPITEKELKDLTN